MQPLVSILIPAYNAEEWIAQTIQSAVAQTWPRKEIIVVDDDRMRFHPNERPVPRLVRFRSLGCYPLSAAVESEASTIEEIVAEMRTTKMSERAGRLIDQEQGSSMERKKREGYF